MKNKTKGTILTVSATVVDVACPLAATFLQFPVWVEKSAEATVSGIFLIMAMLCVIPLFKQIKEYMRSPSIPILWWVTLIIFMMLSSIINQVIIICFVGGISNTIGAGIHKIGKSISEKPDKEKNRERSGEE